MKKEFELEAINMALVEDFSNAHGLTTEQAINTIIREFMVDEFKKQAKVQELHVAPMLNGIKLTDTQTWYSKGSV